MKTSMRRNVKNENGVHKTGISWGDEWGRRWVQIGHVGVGWGNTEMVEKSM